MATANTPSAPSTTSERVSPKAVQKAVDSLLKWRNTKLQNEKAKLFDEDDEFVYLILTLKKIPPKGRVNPHKILLPHSLLSEFSELCLIIDDRPKSNLTKEDAQKKIKSENIPVSKVLKLSKLKSDYRPFEAKRKLCNSYNMFFADKRVIPLLPRLLGKFFFKKKKIPVPLDLKHKNWKEQIEKACSSALLFLRTGTCSVVRVAKVSMDKDEIVENVVAAINGIVEIVPKNWGNVRSFHLKLLESLALPIYQAVPDLKLKIDGVKQEDNAVMEEEEEEEEQGEEEEEGEKVGKGGAKKDQKVGKMKGRIHEVRYMDDKLGEKLSEGESGSEDDGDVAEGDSENEEMGNGESVNKKRKNGKKEEIEALSELDGAKRLKKSAKDKSKEGVKQKKNGLSAKVMKENVVKKSKNKLSVDDGESGKKKKKENGTIQSEGRDMKVKAKKIKQAA